MATNKRQGGQVRFIRKNGRVIPIYVRAGRAAEEAALGTVVAATSGVAAAGLAYTPGFAERVSRGIWAAAVKEHRAKTATQSLSKTARSLLTLKKVAAYGPRIAGPALLGGAALAGAYYARSITHLTDSTGRQKKASAPAVQLATAGALGVGATAFLRASGIKPVSKALMQALTVTPFINSAKKILGL